MVVASHNHSKMALPSRNLPSHFSDISPPCSDPSNGSRKNSETKALSIVTADSDPERDNSNNDPWSNNGSPTMDSSENKYVLSVVFLRLTELTRNAPIRSTGTHPWHRVYGRTYQGFRKWAYFLPCDEREQDRLDIFHKVITEARHGDGLLYSPHPPNARIMDLGCGTGIWALDVANKLPNGHVVGIDLAPIQPPNGPKNCDFYSSFDYESLWEMGEDSWDIIHMQMGSGSVMSWPSLYRRVFSHLRPGAWFEQVEIDFEPRCDDRSLEDTALCGWYKYLKEATQRTMRPLAHSSRDTVLCLQEAGFTEIDHQIVGLPLNPWHHDDQEKKVARWYNLAFSESIEPFSLAVFSRVYGSSLDYIQKTTDAVKRDAYNTDLHVYNILHMYRARKPATPNST